MSDEQTVSYTHQTINDPNGSGNHVAGILIVTGIITLSLLAFSVVALLVYWLMWNFPSLTKENETHIEKNIDIESKQLKEEITNFCIKGDYFFLSLL